MLPTIQNLNLFVLGITIIFFFVVVAIVDYWQASMEHHKYLHPFIKDYFGIWWAVLVACVFPFLFVFAASNFNLGVAKFFLGVFLVGIIIWDLVYSILDTGKLVSAQPIYFYIRGKNWGFSERGMYIWHLSRLSLALVVLLF